MPDANDVALKEFEALRKEISDAVTETRTLERYAGAATAAFWTWLLVQPAGEPWIGFLKWIPACICLLAAIRCVALMQDVVDHARYLREIEKRWGDKKVFHWEDFAVGLATPAVTRTRPVLSVVGSVDSPNGTNVATAAASSEPLAPADSRLVGCSWIGLGRPLLDFC